MANAGLRIPKSQKEAFRTIARVVPDQLYTILSTLRELRPSTRLSSSAQFLSKKTGIEEKEAARLLMLVSSLFTLQERLGLPTEDFHRELLIATEADKELAITNGSRAQVSRFLKEVLALGETLGVTSKIWSVTGDSEHTYCFSRVLTDLRPVFKPNSEEAAVFVPIHNLKIAYHENNDLREFFVAMTADDLRGLSKVLQRAERKHKNLKSVLDSADLLFVEEE